MTVVRPKLRVAVVGSGPSGFYAAGHLLASQDVDVEVDMLERLPTPWGLVRGGVAPDHPKIKLVSRVFEKTARHPRFRFYGNLHVGRDVRHDELLGLYHAVVYAVGCDDDRRLGLPGEELPGSWAARQFVGWYNGHPDHRDLRFDLSGSRAVVVGNGNVAIDVARMLCLTHDELAVTDVADHALDALRDAAVEEIVVLGRRGPEQAAFTLPELLELGRLPDADVVVDPRDLEIPEELRDEDADVAARRKVELLREYAQRRPAGRRKRIVLRFLSSPVEIMGAERVQAVRIVRNELRRSRSGALHAAPTGTEETIETSLVLRAVGYAGVAIPGVPFDHAVGVIPNAGGRVLGADGVLAGVYTGGWIKRGPSGVIGTNKKCAQETVAALLADVAEGRLRPDPRPDREEAHAWLSARCPRLVSYAGWEAIDADERVRGGKHGRPRCKLTRVEELLAAAGV
jgi:ferredoxin/flavodoxin---NADP+ reductase